MSMTFQGWEAFDGPPESHEQREEVVAAQAVGPEAAACLAQGSFDEQILATGTIADQAETEDVEVWVRPMEADWARTDKAADMRPVWLVVVDRLATLNYEPQEAERWMPD